MLPDETIIKLSKMQMERAELTLSFIPSFIEMGDYNTAINRSYYAAFYALKSLELLDGFDTKKHSGAISYFRKNYIKTEKFSTEYSNIIGRLEQTRELSDYNITSVFRLDDAKEMYSLSEKFVSAIKNYLGY